MNCLVPSWLTGATSLIVLSPHLDDAVLSCGGLLATLDGSCPVTVVSLFTAAGPRPHTRAAHSLLRQSGISDGDMLFAERRAEDRRVLGQLGARHLHFGAPDALFRRRALPRSTVNRLNQLLPELTHRYPAYRFVATGLVSRGDRSLATHLADQFHQLLVDTPGAVVLCPLAIGGHADHLITRAVGERCASHPVYYADFPYNQSHQADQRFLKRHGLTPRPWDQGITDKLSLVKGYKTQISVVFPRGEIPTVPETYYTSAARPAPDS